MSVVSPGYSRPSTVCLFSVKYYTYLFSVSVLSQSLLMVTWSKICQNRQSHAKILEKCIEISLYGCFSESLLSLCKMVVTLSAFLKSLNYSFIVSGHKYT